MATVNEVKLMNNGEMVTPVTLAGSVKNLDGSSAIDGLMKKVADSDLDMNRKNITNITATTISNAKGGNVVNKVHTPLFTYINLAVTEGDMSAFFKAYMQKVAEMYPSLTYVMFEGAVNPKSTGDIKGFCVGTGWSNLDSEGVPYYWELTFTGYNGISYKASRTTGSITVEQISSFPFNNTTKDNRINSMGSNYIRCENGLQICWGIKTITTGATSVAGSMNRAKWNPSGSNTLNFPQPFKNNPSVSAVVYSGHSYSITNFIRNNTGVTEILLEGGIAHADGITVDISWIAIGQWK